MPKQSGLQWHVQKANTIRCQAHSPWVCQAYVERLKVWIPVHLPISVETAEDVATTALSASFFVKYLPMQSFVLSSWQAELNETTPWAVV
ncbi:hypothetical protein PoB_002772800 [Plakobranchus ocellatus]|uniref:Uncharacterized protein n=1 Tax=Plakobranchus ocellatus TaxID=259542 RepID=A0AAV4A244_9GAST|nr:hypothetical protein PoB_002772800 [Plakobranchus ocellatus]